MIKILGQQAVDLKNILEVDFVAEQNKELVVIDEAAIKSKIYYIRNQKVMLDFELAEIYGYETRDFNQQVKRNNENLMMILCSN